jgi:hypothetical protein
MVLSGLAAIAIVGGLVLLMGALTGSGQRRRRTSTGVDGSVSWSDGGSDCDSGSCGGDGGGGGGD